MENTSGVKAEIKIRNYTAADKPALLDLLRLNIPLYFDVAEEDDFSDYLDRHTEDYYVVENDGNVAGAGGINYFPECGQARLSWDMVHPDYQGRGIGSRLTRYRISRIQEKQFIRQIVVRTSQLVYRFYEKQGFRLVQIKKDYWAAGFDLYLMEYLPNEVLQKE